MKRKKKRKKAKRKVFTWGKHKIVIVEKKVIQPYADEIYES